MEDTIRQIVIDFMKEQRIDCVEAIYQSDRVILNAYEFIERLCDEIGYLKLPKEFEDEDDD